MRGRLAHTIPTMRGPCPISPASLLPVAKASMRASSPAFNGTLTNSGHTLPLRGGTRRTQARTREMGEEALSCHWANFRDCGEALRGRRYAVIAGNLS